MIDMTEGEAEYLKYRFKQYLGSVSRAIQNKRLEEQKMGMSINNLCNSCTNIGCEFQSGIVRTACAFYMPPQSKPDNCGNYVVMHTDNSTTDRIEIGTDGNLYKLSISNGNEYSSKEKLYTKDNMVAILKELKSEIENKSYVNVNFEGRTVELSDIQRIIINKIYELRGETGCQRL